MTIEDSESPNILCHRPTVATDRESNDLSEFVSTVSDPRSNTGNGWSRLSTLADVEVDTKHRNRPAASSQIPDHASLNETDGRLKNAAMMRQLPKFNLQPRLYFLILLILVVLPFLHGTRIVDTAEASVIGTNAGVLQRSGQQARDGAVPDIEKRANTDTDVCTRWSAQSAVINGTIYIYGGQATQEAGQKSNRWTNDFFSVDLTKSWTIGSPSISGLPQPSGPPAVANGYLWNSYDSLFLYGGIYSDTPEADPQPYSLWEYQLKSSSWVEHSNPKTSNGNNSEGGNQPVQQAGEGAGISIPELGRGYFFAGHLDHFTTPGWSIQTARLYLKSLLEFTFPGYGNDGVEDLSGGKTAGKDGVWRNVTQGGIQDTATFPIRADGSLVYVPGFSKSGILLSIGGGLNTTATASFVSERKIPKTPSC